LLSIWFNVQFLVYKIAKSKVAYTFKFKYEKAIAADRIFSRTHFSIQRQHRIKYQVVQDESGLSQVQK
jgi:hypothetical protein